MGHKTLKELTEDPFLRTLEGRDELQPMTIQRAAGFLAQSLTTLLEWREAGKRPPGWYGEGKNLRYPLGELRRFVREELEKAERMQAPQPAPTAPPEKTSAVEKVKQIAGKDAVKGFGFGDVKMIGGERRTKVRHDSHAQFLSVGAPNDEWVFLMVPSAYPAQTVRRPVDLIASLDMDPDTLVDAECEQLSLESYGEALAAFVRAEGAAERKLRAGELPPPDPDKPPAKPIREGRVKP
jgi:hypothetical protein